MPCYRIWVLCMALSIPVPEVTDCCPGDWHLCRGLWGIFAADPLEGRSRREKRYLKAALRANNVVCPGLGRGNQLVSLV